MIGRLTRDHAPALLLPRRHRPLPRELDAALHRLRAAGDEEHLVVAFRRQLREPRRQPLGRLIFEMQAIAEGRPRHLSPHRFEHARIAVADVRDHRTARSIEITLAVNVPQIDALRAVEQRSAQSCLVEKMRCWPMPVVPQSCRDSHIA